MENREERCRIIRDIIDMEWGMFQRVEGLGGRAACQDQYPTFKIMRSSQFLAWDGETLEAYREDLIRAGKAGRNPVMEKYAYMMESTDPAYYRANLQHRLPPVSEDKAGLIRRILAQLLRWDREVAGEFPGLARRGRPLAATADQPGVTSVETYMEGELKTYSLTTLHLLLRHVERLQREGDNLVRQILRFTVEQYGFSSLEEAEQRLKEPREGEKNGH